MVTLSIHLFGKLTIQSSQQALSRFNSQKATELFCYLLLYRNHPHNREELANLFWGEHCTPQSKKYLRKAIWQLRTEIRKTTPPLSGKVMLIEPEWLQLNVDANIGLDVADFEEAYGSVKDKRGRELNRQDYKTIQQAVELYRGELLEGWYQDWCIFERERLKEMYLAMMGKMIGFCETNRAYEAGVEYGKKILGYDEAHEHTHYRLMRLYHLAGDRTAALRQFECCKAALKQELNVEPSESTVELYTRIMQNTYGSYDPLASMPDDWSDRCLPDITASLNRIKKLLAEQALIQQQLPKEIEALEEALANLE